MNRLLLVAALVSASCAAACDQTPLVSPISLIPRPTAPTPTATEPEPPLDPIPPVRRTFVGTVREANGGPLAGVTVFGQPGARGDGPATTSAPDGSFRIEQTLFSSLFLVREGYHYATWSMPPNTYYQEVQTAEITMQSPIALASGSSLSSTITPDDANFEEVSPFFETIECNPCKLIDVSGAEGGAVVRLSWSGSNPLSLWAGRPYDYPPSIFASGSRGSSEVVRSTRSRVDFILVGINRNGSPTLTESIPFTLTVTKP